MREGQMDGERERKTKEKCNCFFQSSEERASEREVASAKSDTAREVKRCADANTHTRTHSCTETSAHISSTGAREMKICPHLSSSQSCQDKTVMVGV